MGLRSVGGGGIRLKTPVLKASDSQKITWNGNKTATATATWTADKSGYILVLLTMAGYKSHGTVTGASLTVDGKLQGLTTQEYNAQFSVVKVSTGQKVSASITGTTSSSTIDIMSYIYFIGG